MKRPATVAALVTVLGAVGFLTLTWWLVPGEPVPGGRPAPVPVHDLFTPSQVARAEKYSRWARLWGYGSLVVSLLVTGWLGLTGVGRRIVDRFPGGWWVKVVLAVTAVSLAGRLATLPLAAAAHRHRRDAGLSTQGWVDWLRDVTVAEVVTVAATAVALLGIVGTARHWRRAWPALAAGLTGSLVLLGSYVYPVLVEPLFNDFEPLPDGDLRRSIVRLAGVEGVRLDEVLVSDASRRTTTFNARVSGFGPTRRVVVYDNLVDDADADQVLAVVAHELAHAANDDVLVGSLLGVCGVVVGVGCLGLVMRRRGSGGVSDPGSVPRILAYVAVASFVAAPVQNGISRQLEIRADAQALAATDEPHAFVGLQRELALRSLADPTPPGLAQWWFGSHPTVLQRVALARARG